MANNSLSGMLGNYPAQSAQTVQGLQSANTAAMRQSVANATQPQTTQGSQQAGGQLAAKQGQAALAGAEQTQKQATQVGQLGLQQQGMDNRQVLADKQLGIQQKQRDLSNKLSALGEDVKSKILDSNLKFQQDEMGRTYWNERQLMDYKLKQAKTQEEFLAYRQQVQQISARKTQLLKVAAQKIEQQMEQESTSQIKSMDQASKAKLIQAKYGIEQQILADKNRAANRAAMFQAGGAVVGSVFGQVGSQLGGAAGATIGATVGQNW
jgi:hypothetical protein